MKYAAMAWQLTWRDNSTGNVHFAYANCDDDRNALMGILMNKEGILALEPAEMLSSLKQQRSVKTLLEQHISDIDHCVGNLSIDPELNAELIMDLGNDKDDALRVLEYLKQPTDEYLIFRVKRGELGGGKTITKVFGEDNAIKIVRTLNEVGGEYYFDYMTQI